MRSDLTGKVFALEALVREIVSDIDRPIDRYNFNTNFLTHLPSVRAEIARRRGRRAVFSDYDLFSDPAWDILLELYLAFATDIKLSVSSVGLESGVASTTVIRWIAILENYGFIRRTNDSSDKRRHWVSLTRKAIDMMQKNFSAF